MKHQPTLARRVLAVAAGATFMAVLATGNVASAAITVGDSTCDLTGTAGNAAADGSASDPFVIGTASALQEINDCKATFSYYKVSANISLTPLASGAPSWNDGTTGGWTPIGDSGSTFRGSFNGNGKTISGLSVSRLSGDYQGIFGYVQDSVIFNLVIAGTVTGNDYVGGLAGYAADSTLSDITSSVAVTGSGSNVGGVVGKTSESNTDSVTASGVVQVDNSSAVTANYYGGVVGYNYDSTMSNVKATGVVNGYRLVSGTDYSKVDYVGGITGYASYSTVDNVSSSGAVSGKSTVGGLIGYVNYPAISNGTVTSTVSGADYVGGAIGYQSYGGVTAVTTSGAVKGAYEVGGVIGYFENAGASKLKSTGAVSFDNSKDTSYTRGYYFGGLMGQNEYGSVTDSSTSGALTCTNTAKDIYCGYIGGAVGYLDEALMSGVTSSRPVTVDSTSSANESFYIGGLVGHAYYAGIVSSSSSGAVTAKNAKEIGGLVGYIDMGSITKSSASGAVTASIATEKNSTVSAGGLVGLVSYSTHIVKSFATGNVTATGTGAIGVGALVGASSGGQALNIRDSFARGNASGLNEVSGILGSGTSTGTLLTKNVYVTGTVTATIATGKKTDVVANVDADFKVTTRNVLYVNGATTHPGAAKKTTAAMKVTSTMTATQRANVLKTYTNAGFSSTLWAVSATKNGGYAYLK